MDKYEYLGSYVKECPKHGYEAHIALVNKKDKDDKLIYCFACGRPDDEDII